MRYILLSFVWLVKGLASDNTWFDVGLTTLSWLATCGIMRGWQEHDRKAWGDMLDDAAEAIGEMEELEQENDTLREKLGRYEKSHLAKLLEKSQSRAKS